MTDHPDAIELTGFVDGDLDPDARTLVTQHLAKCPGCRQAIADHRRISESFALLGPEPLPSDLKKRVMDSIEAGKTVALPLPPAERAPRARPRFLWLAAAAVLALAIALTINTPLTSADSELLFSPWVLGGQEDISVEYRSGGRFATSELVILRARFRRSGQMQSGRSLDHNHVSVARLQRGRAGRFRGSFTPPRDAVYAVFAVEDVDGNVLDTNHGRLWELLVHDDGGKALFAALEEQIDDVNLRSPSAGLATARRMIDQYPDSAQSWVWLRIFEASITGEIDDSVRANYADRYHSLNSAYWPRDDLSPNAMRAMYRFALRASGDEAEAIRWKNRVLQESPESASAGAVLLDDLLSRRESMPPTAVLSEFERLWAGFELPVIIPVAHFRAVEAGDANAILQWTERYERLQPTRWPDLVSQLLALPALQDAGMEKARRFLADDPILRDERRLLHERRVDQRRRSDRGQRWIYAALAEALVTPGSADDRMNALTRAASMGWDSQVFAALAGERLAVGDTSGSVEMLARVTVDPAAGAAQRDHATRTAQRYVTGGEWAALLDQAEATLWDRVFTDVHPGRTVPDSSTWTDSAGVSVRIHDSFGDSVTLVLYHGVPPGDSVERAADIVTELGGKMVALVAGPPDPAATRWADSLFTGVPVFYDSEGHGQSTFEFPGFPSYAIVDHLGRVRFASDDNTLDNAIRQVAALISIQQAVPVVE